MMGNKFLFVCYECIHVLYHIPGFHGGGEQIDLTYFHCKDSGNIFKYNQRMLDSRIMFLKQIP